MQLYAKVFSDKGFSIYPPLYQPNSFFLRTKPKRDTVEGGGVFGVKWKTNLSELSVGGSSE